MLRLNNVYVYFYFIITLVIANFSNADIRQAIEEQNAYEQVLLSSLSSPEASVQKSALLGLQKIITNQSLKLLVDSSSIILKENFSVYCSALGQMHLISEPAVGEQVNPSLMKNALNILSEKIELNKNESSCFQSFAILSPRALDLEMEEAFKSLNFSKLSNADISNALLVLLYHRMNTYINDNPAGNYVVSKDLSIFLKSLNLLNHPDEAVRESYLFSYFFIIGKLGFEDLSKMLADTSPKVRALATSYYTFSSEEEINFLVNQLSDPSYQVVLAAIENLKELNKLDILASNYKSLIQHPQYQVRYSVVSALENNLAIDDYKSLLKDASLVLRQLAARNVIRLNINPPIDFANEVMAGSDVGLKKGLIEGSVYFDENQKNSILKTFINCTDYHLKIFALNFAQENNITSLYSELLLSLTATTLAERIEAVRALLKWKGSPNRIDLILSTYLNSNVPNLDQLRAEIIDYLSSSKEVDEKKLLISFLEKEKSWMLQNKIGKILAENGLANYIPKNPEWKSSPGSKYIVLEDRPQIEITTTKGDMIFELFNDLAPLHVSEVLWSIEHGLWNNNFFHRVLDNFVAQAFQPESLGGVNSGNIRAEISGIRQSRGTLAAPRSDYLHSASGSDLYINLNTNFSLDFEYSAFGVLISGDSILDKLEVGDQIISVKRIK